MQADILRKYTKAPIGTDTIPLDGVDYETLTEKCDIIQYNHYDHPKDLHVQRFWYDFVRPLKDRPFWNTETSTCWNGSEATEQSIKPYGFCRVNSWLPLILGGESAMYWLWRTHWAGHELTHGAVLDTSGRPMHIWGEVRDTAELMEKTGDFLRETRVRSEVGFHYTARNWNMMDTQPIVTGLDYFRAYDFFRPLADQGLSPDIIDAKEPLDKYRLIVSPLMMTLEEGDLPERMTEWVKAGGVWVVGPLSDIRTNVGTRYQHKPFGILEELTGAKWCYGMPDRVGAVKAVWAEDGDTFQGGTWYDAFDETPENTLVRIAHTHSAIDGKACVVHRKVGKGHVIILGTFPAYAELKRIFSFACSLADQPHDCVEGELIVAPREGNPYTGDGREGVILLEYSGKTSGTYTFSGKLRNLVTGEVLTDKIELPPYGIAVLERE
jgi:beta-galactosidase GanA